VRPPRSRRMRIKRLWLRPHDRPMKTLAHNSGNGALRFAYSVDEPAMRARRITHHATRLPAVSPRLLRAFSAYSRWYVSRHIHSIRISRAGTIPNLAELPLVIYTNHASWWDPLVCLTLQNAFFEKRRAFAPIDAVALKKYRFFAKLGFFGVEQTSLKGAGQFLRTAEAVLARPDSILWLTPQGRFVDVRARPVQFKPGLGHLPRRIERAAFAPLAIEYTHWEERKPEVLCRFGPIEIVGGTTAHPDVHDLDWTRYFERRLEVTQNALAAEVQQRRAEDFDPILTGSSGVGFFYDGWRALRSAFTGDKFQREHGSL
jgi:1-acyl-sn-glycerol-3-phosphate acyltransferase